MVKQTATFCSLSWCWLEQAMGAANEEDLDGAMVATLVNKGALDVIAKVS